MLDAHEEDIVRLDPGPPLLTVVIDTEAEFNWAGPFHRNLTGVNNIRRLLPAQLLLERYGIKPAYMVDFAVSSQPAGYELLRALHADGRCEIGTHLQPWETPPFDEDTTEINSYLGNLSVGLQREKLIRMTAIIEESFNLRPTLYKAGRYGIGPATPNLLAELGYQIDLSVLPGTDLRHRHGPDFTRCPSRPYWFGPGHALLEIPMTVGYTGLLGGWGRGAHARTSGPLSTRLRLPGLLARLALLERISLTPEGITFPELCRLTEQLLRQGQRSFTLSYHSPSLMPGSTPYVRDDAELAGFIKCIEAYLDYFFGTLGGAAATPSELRRLALAARDESSIRADAAVEAPPRTSQRGRSRR